MALPPPSLYPWVVPPRCVHVQAQAYFSEAQHASLVDALLSFGESRLGCRAITPIWVSFYTDGMMQEMHCDNPHGPFAFVLSLTSELRCWKHGQACVEGSVGLPYTLNPVGFHQEHMGFQPFTDTNRLQTDIRKNTVQPTNGYQSNHTFC